MLKFPSPLTQAVYNATHDENDKEKSDVDWQTELESVTGALLDLFIERLPAWKDSPLSRVAPSHIEELLDDLMHLNKADERTIRAELPDELNMIDESSLEILAQFLSIIQLIEKAKECSDLEDPFERLRRFMIDRFNLSDHELLTTITKALRKESEPSEPRAGEDNRR